MNINQHLDSRKKVTNYKYSFLLDLSKKQQNLVNQTFNQMILLVLDEVNKNQKNSNINFFHNWIEIPQNKTFKLSKDGKGYEFIDKVKFAKYPQPIKVLEKKEIPQSSQLQEINQKKEQEILQLKQTLQEQITKNQKQSQENQNLKYSLQQKEELISDILQQNQQLNERISVLENEKQQDFMKKFKSKKEEIMQTWNKNQSLYKVIYKDLSHFTENYEKGKYIASGGYGEIYHLHPKQNEKTIKKVNPNQQTQNMVVKELDCYNHSKQKQEREVLSFQQINTLPEDLRKYVITFKETYYDNIEQKIYLTMPLAKHSLKIDINKRKVQKKYYTNQELCYQLGCSLLGLVTLENLGIAHRDVKTDNLLVMDDGSINIADFGESKKVQYEVKEGTLVKGTPQYWSPEQFVYFLKLQQKDQDFDLYDYTNEENITQKDYTKSDLFSIGQCFLQATLLVDCPPAYNLNSLNTQLVNQYVTDRLKQHEDIISVLKNDKNAQSAMQRLGLQKGQVPQYSPELVSLLERIVKTNPKERPTLNKCLDFLVSIQGW